MGSRIIHYRNHRISLEPSFIGLQSVECIRVSRIVYGSGNGGRFLHDADKTGVSSTEKSLNTKHQSLDGTRSALRSVAAALGNGGGPVGEHPSFRPLLLPGNPANWLDEVRVELTNRKVVGGIAWLPGLTLGGGPGAVRGSSAGLGLGLAMAGAQRHWPPHFPTKSHGDSVIIARP